MTHAQKKIVATWIAAFLFILICSVFEAWIRAHWQTIRWPMLAVILVAASLSNRSPLHHKQGSELTRIMEEHPWMKIYLVSYCLVLAVGIYYCLSRNIDIYSKIGFFELFAAVALLILPAVIVKQKEAYRNAGAKSNE